MYDKYKYIRKLLSFHMIRETMGKGMVMGMENERRRTKRLDLESSLVINRLDGQGEERVDINVLDVSKRGIGFSCDKTLQIGAVYEGSLTLWTKETISTFIEIVRIEKTDNSFLYGGIFIGMPETDSNRISVYDVVHRSVDGNNK